MKRFSAVYIAGGAARRMTFEAEDLDDAKRLAAGWNVGVEGEAPQEGVVKAALPEAYDVETSAKMLGGVSRRTIWKWLTLGRLERVPDIRRVLITRRSLEALGARN